MDRLELPASSGRDRPELRPRTHQDVGLGVGDGAPFGILDYGRLRLGAACVLSDSGTISEESAIPGFPAVTLRSSIDRPEALDTGAITMTDLEPSTVVRGVRFAMARGGGGEQPADHQVTNTSERVVNLILSTAFQHEFWSGLR